MFTLVHSRRKVSEIKTKSIFLFWICADCCIVNLATHWPVWAALLTQWLIQFFQNRTFSFSFYKIENLCFCLFVFKVRNYNLVAEENWNESLLLLLKNNFVRVGNKKRQLCQGCVFVKGATLNFLILNKISFNKQ